MGPPGSPRSARWTAAGLLGLAFVAGALGGVAADRVLAARDAGDGRFAPAPPAARGAERRPGAIFPPGFAIARELELSPQQREQIQSILTRERVKADSLLREMRPALQAHYDSSSQAVRAVLTPEQRERFDSLREERRERLRARVPRRTRARPR